MKLEFYEPHMCCPTGVCGPSPDQRLLRIKETIEKLQREHPELDIQRYMISRQPHQFRANGEVYELVVKKGKAVLPITVFDNKVIATSEYPSKETLEALIQGTRQV